MKKALVIALGALWPWCVEAQIVPQGASPETVVQALGSPRSRSAAKGREIWLYPEYQVVFEHGRMTSLTALPADGGNIAWQNRPATSGTPGVLATTVAPPAKAPGPADAKAKAGGPVMMSAESGKITLRSPERRPLPPPRPEPGWWSRLWPYLLLTLVVGGGLWWAVVKVRAWMVGHLTGLGWMKKPAAPKTGTEPAAAAAPVRSGDPTSGTNAAATREAKPPTLADWELTGEILRALEWKRFELLVQRYFAGLGFRTKGAGTGADDGVDIYLFRASASKPLTCVQCRAWGSRRVDEVQVRTLFGLMAAQQIPEGAVVTTGGFEAEALMFGRQNRLTLISGDDFLARFNRLPHLVRARILDEVLAGDFTTPSCPRCGGKLLVTVNDADKAPGWTCQSYPNCRYTMNAPTEAGASAARG